jgi:hypothetical protein
MTLNSIDWSDEITYIYNNEKITKPIGKFIDNLLNENNSKVSKIDNNTETEYLDISHLNIQIASVDINGKTSLKLVEAVTRHLPGHDGKLVNIITETRRSVSATKSKSFLIKQNDQIVEIDGDKIKIGDRLPIDINFMTNDEITRLDKNHIFNDVYMDKIISLEYVDPSHPKVYDLTVADTRNFTIANGLCMRDTFHSTGVGVKGMQGIPRFREILSYSKKIQTPYMIIKLIPQVRAEQNIAHKIEAYLKHTIFGNLIERMDIVYDPTPDNTLDSDNINKENTYYINGGSAGLDNLPWLYKFVISRESMLENDISLLDIKTKFIKYWEDYKNNSSVTKKKAVISRIVNGCVMSNFDNSESPIIHIRYDINNPDNYTLIEIGQFMLNNISIKGVATIEKVDRVDKQRVIEYDDDMSIKSIANEWVIYTTGIDLNKIKTIKHINFESVYINDIYMSYLNFGIEAARNLILRETDILYNGSGNDINVTHLSLLGDIMTNTGNITSIDRHGINRLDTDPLSRASFEKTVEQLLMASAFNEVDHMRSVSSRIMAGRCIKGGTGLCEIMVDNDIIENSEYGTQASYITTNRAMLETNAQIDDIMTQEIDMGFMP